MSIDLDVNKAGRMWMSCCELLVSQDPHDIARCGGLRRSPLSSRTSIKVATTSRGSVSIDVQTEVSINIRWKVSVDGGVTSVHGGKRVSVDEIVVGVDGG
ncbi:hypothetical protein F2Q68_00039139 [Brassica cretica]|uniref:Uncharacterized protein n=1 Tax=Brassica cretica TaxID=69181 RepID=A0A8S9ME21_BRACR|nr:hypothetical protein F2Q68_00039139 [Brassica cretica]